MIANYRESDVLNVLVAQQSLQSTKCTESGQGLAKGQQ